MLLPGPAQITPGGVGGNGLPNGGTTGQILDKLSNANQDAGWIDPALASNATPLPASGAGSPGVATSYMRSDAYPPAGAGVPGALLGRVFYAPNPAVGIAIGSGGLTAVDAAHLTVGFTTSGSGAGSTEVFVLLQAGMACDTLIMWGVVGTGAPASAYEITNNNPSIVLYQVEFVVTGLTPSTTYSWSFAYVGGNVSNTIYCGSDTGLQNGTTPALMKITAGLV